MVKVCIITSSFPRQKNSYEGIFIKKFIENFSNKISFTVLAPSDKKESNLNYDRYKVIWVRYSLKKWERLFYTGGGVPQKIKQSVFTYWNLPFYIISMIFSALKNSKNNDVIHVQWLQNGIFGILPKLLWRKPLVITIHGSDLKLFLNSKFHKLVGKFIIYFADALITVNEEFEEILTQKYPNKLIKYIPYAYKINKVGNGHIKDINKPKTLLFVGSLTKEKGLLDLMVVYEKIVSSGIYAQLRIIGTGALYDDLINWSKKFDTTQVQIIGAKSNDDVIIEMLDADMLLLPSYSEGRPTVVLEAMSNGLPVIATNLKGIEEVIADNYNGKLFTPGDKEMFFTILKEAITGNLPLQEYINNSYILLDRKKLTVENTNENHLIVYNSILKKLKNEG